MKRHFLFLVFIVFMAVTNLYAQVSFSSAVENITGATASDLIAADFNNDGKVDIFVRVANSLKLFLGNGTPILSTPISLPTSTANITICTFDKSDINNDGNLDIIFHDRGTGKIYSLIGNGSGGFTILVGTNNTQEYHSPSGIKCGDFNNDGKSDVVISTSGTNFKMSLGNGNGTFQNSTALTMPLTSYTGGGFYAVDCNNDGNIDLATLKGFAFGNGLGVLNSSLEVNTTNYPNDFVRDDFNNDGFKDLAVTSKGPTNFEGKLTLYLSNSTSEFLPSTNFDYALNTVPVGIAKGDFNNDGILDIATCDYTNNNYTTYNYSVSVYIGTGAGNFDAPIQLTLDAYPKNIAIADIDSNGKQDIIVATTTFQSANPTVGKLVLFYNNSTLSNSTFSEIESEVNVYPNPTNGIINIKTSFEKLNYKITDVNEKLLSEDNLDSSKSIDFSNYSNGLYFVTIKNKDFNKTYKIVKN